MDTIIPEEFPEGSYGSDLISKSLGKSSPWKMEQQTVKAFEHEKSKSHQHFKRKYPGEDDFEHSFPDAQDEP